MRSESVRVKDDETRRGCAAEGRTQAVDYDAELRLHDEVLRKAHGIRAPDHVLDVGCGTGRTTREAARLAHAGRAVGIDTSAQMIDRARALAATEGRHNATFICADAQVHPLPPGRFDVVISRYGTMFFRDPVAAFANVGRAVRPGGRLVMMVWQAHERNEWSVALERALGAAAGSAISVREPLDPFSLGDAATTEGILDATGFADVAFTDVHEPVYYGPDVDAALAWVSGFACTAEVLKRLDPASTERLRERLRRMLADHLGEGGVWFDARAWIVTARRADGGRATEVGSPHRQGARRDRTSIGIRLGRGEAPADYWANTRYGYESRQPFEDPIELFYQDVPRALATEPLRRGRAQSEGPDGRAVAPGGLARRPHPGPALPGRPPVSGAVPPPRRNGSASASSPVRSTADTRPP